MKQKLCTMYCQMRSEKLAASICKTCEVYKYLKICDWSLFHDCSIALSDPKSAPRQNYKYISHKSYSVAETSSAPEMVDACFCSAGNDFMFDSFCLDKK